jgi:single-strand DNA-binding protein
VPSLNKVFLVGKIFDTPETRTLPSGEARTKFTIETGEFYNNENHPEYHTVIVNKDLGNHPSYQKGAVVSVEGSVQTRTWEDGNGQKRRATEVIAFRFSPEFATVAGRTSSSNGGGNSQPTSAGEDDW